MVHREDVWNGAPPYTAAELEAYLAKGYTQQQVDEYYVKQIVRGVEKRAQQSKAKMPPKGSLPPSQAHLMLGAEPAPVASAATAAAKSGVDVWNGSPPYSAEELAYYLSLGWTKAEVCGLRLGAWGKWDGRDAQLDEYCLSQLQQAHETAKSKIAAG